MIEIVTTLNFEPFSGEARFPIGPFSLVPLLEGVFDIEGIRDDIPDRTLTLAGTFSIQGPLDMVSGPFSIEQYGVTPLLGYDLNTNTYPASVSLVPYPPNAFPGVGQFRPFPELPYNSQWSIIWEGVIDGEDYQLSLGITEFRSGMSITLIPIAAIAITVPGGDFQECSQSGGSIVALEANAILMDGDSVTDISWSLNGSETGTGDSINLFVPLGNNLVEVSMQTANGNTASDTQQLVITDTTPPTVFAAFLNPKSGTEVTEVKSKQSVLASYLAQDICDPVPVTKAITGMESQSGVKVKPKLYAKTGEMDVSIVGSETRDIQLIVTAEDASGNLAEESAALFVTP